MRVRALLTVAVLASSALLMPLSAEGTSRVRVTNSQGTSSVDPTYATTIRVSGSGFQSIKGGHGGIYVFFGTVNGRWRPSQGGQTGRNMYYVPDSESKGNQGFQRFVAFPGSDTAGSANGGTIKADGTWSTSMVVPGATFNAVDRSGKAKKIDCRTTACGIITIGAHGVKNARNETFTPVPFADLTKGSASSASGTAATAAPGTAAGSTPTPSTKKTAKAAAAKLTVDRSTAKAGRVLSFDAIGLTPGDQVVASFDDGVAAVGPLNVGPNGQVAGVVQLPTTTGAGTHTLRLVGGSSAATTNFAVSAATAPVADEASSGTPWLPIGFAAAGVVLLLAALALSVVRIRSVRRKVIGHAV
jgi:hypothetical protein